MDVLLFKKPLFVSLASQIDKSRFSQISINAKIEELNKPNGMIYFQVENIKAASKLCRKFINEFNLGASNWIGGRVIDEEYNFIAQISYNGRAWNDEESSKAQEIVL